MAPGLITPKPFHLVIDTSDQRSLLSVAMGVWVYYLIQLFQGQFFPPPKIYTRRPTIQGLFSDLDSSIVKAVYEFWDSETDDARLVIENIQSGFDRGGMAVNYVELLSYNVGTAGVQAKLRNLETNEEIDVKTKVLFNASGPWLDEVRKRDRAKKEEIFPWLDRVAGAHIDVIPPVSTRSFYITAPDGRLVFLLRRDEDGLVYTRIGTTERPLTFLDSSDGIRATPVEVDYLLDVARQHLDLDPANSMRILRTDEGIQD
jgi:glycerol-3-phosphate dehydrogenase